MKKTKEELVNDCLKLCKENSPKDVIFFNIGIVKAKSLGAFYKANLFVITVGTLLMDIKLQEARKAGIIEKHVEMSIEFAKVFLKNYSITEEEFNQIICCIREHHLIEHTSLEAEIVSNADCYRFLYPISVFSYLKILLERGLNVHEALQQVKNKVDEKYHLLTLSKAIEELTDSYHSFEILLRNIDEDYV